MVKGAYQKVEVFFSEYTRGIVKRADDPAPGKISSISHHLPDDGRISCGLARDILDKMTIFGPELSSVTETILRLGELVGLNQPDDCLLCHVIFPTGMAFFSIIVFIGPILE